MHTHTHTHTHACTHRVLTHTHTHTYTHTQPSTISSTHSPQHPLCSPSFLHAPNHPCSLILCIAPAFHSNSQSPPPPPLLSQPSHPPLQESQCSELSDPPGFQSTGPNLIMRHVQRQTDLRHSMHGLWTRSGELGTLLLRMLWED